MNRYVGRRLNRVIGIPALHGYIWCRGFGQFEVSIDIVLSECFASDVVMKLLSVPAEEKVTCQEDFESLFPSKKIKSYPSQVLLMSVLSSHRKSLQENKDLGLVNPLRCPQ